MGDQAVKSKIQAEQLRAFEKHLLKDIRALEYLLEHDAFEKDIRRIGAEQELFIVAKNFQPAPLAIEILQKIDDPHFTTEIARFNLEVNIDPLVLGGNCFSALHQRIDSYVAKAGEAAADFGAEILLTGMLPTLRKSHLDLDNMTPRPRYAALNEAMTRMRGREYELFLRGTDELYMKHDSVMLEACNTSFQVHLQVRPGEFARFYNIAQAIAAPVMAAAVNSPLLFGRRLWHETRIAVFQQAIDTRRLPPHLRDTFPRVSFGNNWVKDSVLEIFQEDIMRYRVLIGAEIDEMAFEAIEQGRAPKLKALQVHNSTVYRWNRPCYGVTDGKPHLRIENRILPSGPTVIDEIATAVFWDGLLAGMAAEYEDITGKIAFDTAKSNFVFAARRGLQAQFSWFEGKTVPAQKLITQKLLPLAKSGLCEWKVDNQDIGRYLGIIEERMKSGQTGAAWLVRSFDQMQAEGSTDARLSSLVAATLKQQKSGKPVHTWPLAKILRKGDWMQHFHQIKQFMTTDLFTVNEDDTVELVLNMMKWRRIRHIPVEDSDHKLVGLVTYRSLIRYIYYHSDGNDHSLVPVSAIMKKNVTVVSRDTPSLEAIELMKREGLTCLPVVQGERLIGIVTEQDFMKIAAAFLEAKFKTGK
jgi:CBS domain-containing protein/gamma-glutamyl:cysteine ligase YbdK (ATP-grasp superfamily)